MVWYIQVVRCMSMSIHKTRPIYMHVIGDIDDIKSNMRERGYSVTHAVPITWRGDFPY